MGRREAAKNLFFICWGPGGHVSPKSLWRLSALPLFASLRLRTHARERVHDTRSLTRAVLSSRRGRKAPAAGENAEAKREREEMREREKTKE